MILFMTIFAVNIVQMFVHFHSKYFVTKILIFTPALVGTTLFSKITNDCTSVGCSHGSVSVLVQIHLVLGGVRIGTRARLSSSLLW